MQSVTAGSSKLLRNLLTYEFCAALRPLTNDNDPTEIVSRIYFVERQTVMVMHKPSNLI